MTLCQTCQTCQTCWLLSASKLTLLLCYLVILGGAPELCNEFRFLAKEAVALGKKVIDRCNLTALLEPGRHIFLKKRAHVLQWQEKAWLFPSSNIPVDISGTVLGECLDCLLLSGIVVGENPDHVCWDAYL